MILTNTQTNVERRAVSNEVGLYVFLNIIPGDYRLQASKTSFKTSKQSPFTLAVNQTATYDFTLEIGEVTQLVTVEAVGAELQSSTAELGAVVSQQQAVSLPLNGRNFTQMLALTPGVSPVSVAQNAGGFGAQPSSNSTFTFPSINGQNNTHNMYLLDGINNLQPFTATYAVPPIMDTVQEFKVQSHNDQAEFGGVTGGIVNVVTKSGTNEFHGAAWEFLRNDALDARNTFLLKKTPFRQNMFGGAVGGPVLVPKYNGRNKTFFYGAYQGFRFRRPADSLFRVPTEANLRGDLSDEPRQIYNPFTTRPDPNNPGRFIRDPFPNNQIPPGLLSPGMLLYARTVLPKPEFTGNPLRNAINSAPFSQNQTEWTIKVDQVVGSNDSVWFRYSQFDQDSAGAGALASLSRVTKTTSRNYGLNYVHTFSSASLLQAQFGRSLVDVNPRNKSQFRNVPPDFAKQVGFSPAFSGNWVGTSETFTPSLNVPNFFSGGEGSTAYKVGDVHEAKVNVAKTAGTHTFKWGGELSSSGYRAFNARSSVTFGVPQTSNPSNPAGTGSELASFLLDVPDRAFRFNDIESLRWGGTLGFYFQDQWKLTQKLMLNLGLRYNRTWVPPFGREEDGNLAIGNYDMNRGVYVIQQQPGLCSQVGKVPCIPGNGLPEHVELSPNGKVLDDYTDNWQPRVGLAYRLGQNTVVRASFGIFFDSWAGVNENIQGATGTWPNETLQDAGNLNNILSVSPLPDRSALDPFRGRNQLPAPDPFEQGLWSVDPHERNPYSMQWNLGFQQEINSSTVLTANYVGSGSRRLPLGGVYGAALTPGPGNPRDRFPFPYIKTPPRYDRSWGRSNYHAFQFSLDKKFSRGLAYLVSYTWSKAIDIGSSGRYGAEGQAIQDQYHFNNDRSQSPFDLTHVLSINWVYELPVGPGRRFGPSNRILSHIVGQWQLNGISTLQSGTPFTLFVSGDLANIGDFSNNYLRPNYIGGNATLSSPTPAKWFNTSAFAVPSPFTFGNFGRYRLRGDGTVNFDLSIFRQFPIREQKRLEFRAELFNAFNTPVFSAPDRNILSGTFGRVFSTANQARQIQLALKFIF
ncbi:MAG: TonB-dependent receptor [Acidobacteria bacterium]|nr:TonB-dependent receptor [Acidobacteriota bacterium]MCI0723614.1 TonB-dependent receptor [Acidobacteriota bacterium]